MAACSEDNGDSSTGDDSGSGDDPGSSKVDADKDGYNSTEDCDDTNAAVHPGAKEVCDEIDNNCVDGIDEGMTTPFYADTDGDTYGAGTAVDACTAPKGHVENADDCDDTTAAAYPGGTEVCDGIDNDCAGGVDDGVTTPFYGDGDGDGYGAGTATDACAAPTGYVNNADDCNDLVAYAHPGGTEVCDTFDNDCDGDIDDDDSGVTGTSTYYRDLDGDGYGLSWHTTTACEAPLGYVDNGDDCDDFDSSVNLLAYVYWDGDLDGYGTGPSFAVCYVDGYAAVVGDCDDGDDTINPGATEVCDEVDNNCDTLIDGDDPAVAYDTWYADSDSDGYGDDSTAFSACAPGPSYATTGGDCDDADYLVSPGRDEYCDGIDNNCTGGADETTDYVDWYRDDDGDHYGQDDDVVNDCAPPTGYDLRGGDCDDDNTEVNPGHDEVCSDDLDNECDGYVDNCFVDLDDAVFSLSGNTDYDYVGWSVGSGDVDGDGTDDLLVGSPFADTSVGAIYVVKGPASGSITVADVDATITGVSCGLYCGDAFAMKVTAGDVDGDSYYDVLGATGYSNEVFLFLGPISSTTTASADVTFTSPIMYGGFGDAIALADLDGDADLDTAIGEPYDWKSFSYGNVYIFMGPVSGSGSSADLVVTGSTMYGWGARVANVGDIDGDGLDDLAQGAQWGGSSSQGEVFLLDDPGSTTGTVTASSIAVATMTGESYGDTFGYRIAGGDYNNDGYDDLFVTAVAYYDGVTYGLGRVYGWLGPVSGAYAGSSANVMVTGDVESGNFGSDIALGDVNGDSADDVVIGRPNGDTYVGAAYLLSGPTTGSIDLASMAMLGDPTGVDEGAYVGSAVGTIRDWSGDGANEVIVGAYGMPMPYDASSWGAGKTWVVSSDDL